MKYDTPDQGYAWVVMTACFALQMLISSSFATFGILLVEYIEYFQQDKTVTSWIGAILLAAMGMMGIFTGPLVQRFGCRRMTQVGTLLVFIGLGSSAFVPNVYILYLTHGFIAGTGYSFWNVSATTAVQLFFDKKRGFATAFTTAGMSAGVLLWSWLTPFAIATYTFKGSLLLLAAANFHGLIIAVVLRKPVYRPPSDIYTPGKKASVGRSDAGSWSDVSLNSIKADSFGVRYMPSTMEQPYNENGATQWSHMDMEIDRCSVSGHRRKSSVDPPKNSRRFRPTDLLDFSLMKEVPMLTIFFFCVVLIEFGDQVPYVFLPVRVAEAGRTKDDAGLLVMVLGITTVIARIFFGWVGDQSWADRKVMFAIASVSTGVTSAVFAFVTNFVAFVAYCVTFSICVACYASIGYAIIGDILGPRQLAKGLGLLLFFVGLGLLLGTSLGGFISDSTGKTSMAFLILGLIQATGGAIWTVTIVYERLRDHMKRSRVPDTTEPL